MMTRAVILTRRKSTFYGSCGESAAVKRWRPCLCASTEPRSVHPGRPHWRRRHRHLWQNMRCRPMPFVRNRSAWMWLAIAAVAFTSVARAETGLRSSRTGAHTVLEFLARSQTHNPGANLAGLRSGTFSSRRQAASMLRKASSGSLTGMLPVFFIGLVSPSDFLSGASIRCLGRAPAGPLLPDLFQRPPPSLA
jgi:hypothetical protein